MVSCMWDFSNVYILTIVVLFLFCFCHNFFCILPNCPLSTPSTFCYLKKKNLIITFSIFTNHCTFFTISSWLSFFCILKTSLYQRTDYSFFSRKLTLLSLPSKIVLILFSINPFCQWSKVWLLGPLWQRRLGDTRDY